MRPFFPFYGSKWNIARYYGSPKYPTVIEPFAGAAGYSTFWEPARVILVEKDPILVATWQYLLATTPDRIMALPELPRAGDSVDNYELEPGARSLIGFWLNRGSATPKLTRTEYSARTDKAQLNWGPRAKERIASQLSGLVNWEIHFADFSQSPVVSGEWFIDPPYVEKGKWYRFGSNQLNYQQLAQFSRQCVGHVTVCEGPTAAWLPFQPLGSFKSSSGRADEYIWRKELDLS